MKPELKVGDILVVRCLPKGSGRLYQKYYFPKIGERTEVIEVDGPIVTLKRENGSKVVWSNPHIPDDAGIYWVKEE